MIGIYHDANSIGYNASRVIQMVNEVGGLSAAKQLINSDQPSEGFTRLWELGRLDVAVEARALKPGFRPLFTAPELKKCRDRLSAYDWRQQPPRQQPSALRDLRTSRPDEARP